MKDIFQLMESSCGSYLKKNHRQFYIDRLGRVSYLLVENKRYYVFRYERYKFSV